MELAVFKSIVDLGMSLFNLSTQLNKADENERKRVGKWIEDLGQLIESVACSLERQEFPHAACAKMQYMIQSFPQIIDNNVQHLNDLKRLISLLDEAQNLERLFTELQTLYEDDRLVYVIKIKQVGGTLQGAGSVLSAL